MLRFELIKTDESENERNITLMRNLGNTDFAATESLQEFQNFQRIMFYS